MKINLKFLLMVKLSTLEFWSIYFLYNWFLNLQREVRPLVVLSWFFHNLVPLARNERLPVMVLKKGMDKSILCVLCIMHNFLCSIMLLIGIQPSLLQRPTVLSVPAFKITLTQRFWVLRSLCKLSILVFPHTDQQYSKIGLIKALHSKVLSDRFRYFLALLRRFTLEFNLVIM